MKQFKISNENLTFNGKKVLTEGDILGLPLGTLIPSTVVQNNNPCLHLANGAVESQTGIYAEFAKWLKSIYPNGDYTNEQFEQDLLNFGGQCGHYVIDDENSTIRFPRITEFVASNIGEKPLGTAEKDSFKSHNHSVTIDTKNIEGSAQVVGPPGYGWGVFSLSENTGAGQGLFDSAGAGGWGKASYLGFNANHNHTGTISNNGEAETKPKNIRYPYYIVVASGVNTIVKINIENYLSDLTNLSEQITKINNKFTSKVLWENVNYSSDFPAQTIDIGEPISNYNYIEIYFANGCTKIKVSNKTAYTYLSDATATYYNIIASRKVSFSDSKFIISDADKYNVDGIKNNSQPETKVNNFCKPLYIIGYKEID